jgi:parallel beta-helix repeat protein
MPDQRVEVPINKIRFGVVGFVGFLALLQGWTNTHRPYPSQLSGATNVRVTTGDDRGPGSLREAILSADRASGRARVEVLVSRITLAGSLPPLINPRGVTIESASGQFSVDASHVSSGSVLEIRSPGVVIRNMRVENSPHTALVLAAHDLKIENSAFSGCDTAVEVAPGGGDLLIENSVLDKNRIGLLADSFERNVTVQNSKFLSQTQAGIWAVTDSMKPTVFELNIGGNQFSANHFGVVAANHRVQIHDNDITLSQEAGIQLFGEGATVQHNRISEGLATGILADSTTGAMISDNEIHHNRNVAIVMKNSGDDAIRHNTIYSNGNGIAFVYGHSGNPIVASQNVIFSQTGEALVIAGDSPILRDNVLRSNNLGGAPASALPGRRN